MCPQLVAARVAEISQRIHRIVVYDLCQIAKRLVRREVRLDDGAHDAVRTRDNGCRGKDTHPADQRVEPYQICDLRLIVLESVRVPLDASSMKFLYSSSRLLRLPARCCALNCTCCVSHDAVKDVRPPIVDPARAATAERYAGSKVQSANAAIAESTRRTDTRDMPRAENPVQAESADFRTPPGRVTMAAASLQTTRVSAHTPESMLQTISGRVSLYTDRPPGTVVEWPWACYCRHPGVAASVGRVEYG